jgi:hypothetical protein
MKRFLVLTVISTVVSVLATLLVRRWLEGRATQEGEVEEWL